MILTVTLNPSVDKLFEVPNLSPGSLNRIAKTDTQPGGKGVNVSFMLRALGHEVTAMGFAGDGPGRFIQNSLRDAGITTSFTTLAGKTRTNYAIVDSEAGTLTDLRSPGPRVDPADIESLRATFERLLGLVEMVVIAGSLPPGVDPSFCAELTTLAASRGTRVALNVREELLEKALVGRPFLAEPDLRGSQTYGGLDLATRDERIALARQLARRCQIAVVNFADEVLCVSGDTTLLVSVPACGLLGRLRLDDALLAGMIDATVSRKDLPDIAREGVAGALAAAASPDGRFSSVEDIRGCMDRIEVIELA